ncbi:MAG: hypothetical protein PHN56_02910 [Candidatus Nanoarchaeia archaeon]|nr:hypothetical protein [Candidatus Nanoarchaeia archaeon]
MANENEIIDKIKNFKEQKSPDFKKYMNFYKEKFPEFYNSKLKSFEESEISQENTEINQKTTFDFSSKGEVEKKENKIEISTNEPVFNINEGKKEINNPITATPAEVIPKIEKPAEIKPIAKKNNKKLIIIILITLILIGAITGTYFILK